MKMHKPPRLGKFIVETYMKPLKLSCRYLAEKLDVARSIFNRSIKQQSGVSPEMALRLSKSLSRSSQSWLLMQDSYDLFVAQTTVKLVRVKPIEF